MYPLEHVVLGILTRAGALSLSLCLSCLPCQALSKSLEDGGRARQATESQLQQWQARESTLLLEQVLAGRQCQHLWGSVDWCCSCCSSFRSDLSARSPSLSLRPGGFGSKGDKYSSCRIGIGCLLQFWTLGGLYGGHGLCVLRARELELVWLFFN